MLRGLHPVLVDFIDGKCHIGKRAGQFGSQIPDLGVTAKRPGEHPSYREGF